MHPVHIRVRKDLTFIMCLSLLVLSGGLRAAEQMARNLAPRARITASANAEHASAVVDGEVPMAGSRGGATWTVPNDKLPATLTFTWEQPIRVASLAYYARTTWGLENFKDYQVYVDDAGKPVARGAFRRGHGPQLVHLPEPVRARKLTLKFLSGEGKRHSGASEVQVFTSRPSQEALLCRFSDFKLDFRYAYYPSHDLVRFLVPKPPEDATRWHVALRSKKSDQVLAERGGELPMAPAAENLEVPDLPDGDYVLTLRLSGGEAPVIAERGFQRNHYEWEGRELGMEEVVIPPFEPLAADAEKQTVEAVLRRHTHDGTGLWKQVNSREEDLLADPVRLEATVDGKTVVADGGGAEFTTVRDTRVSGRADWKAGALSGATHFDYDYDGLMQVMLQLEPTETEIQGLDLVIPIKTSQASVMHPVTTGLRHHYAGRIPGGEGRVWDSSSVRGRIEGFFVPYIYVGGPERGICFAAENVLDWIRDGETPMMAIEREGKSLRLRLHLIGRPSKLTRRRTITFYLQATPAKPMPQEPYDWRRWWATGTSRDARDVQIAFWGANMYWGGRFFATSVYPAGKDYGFWEQLAEQRRTGQMDRAYLERWMEQFENVPKNKRASLRAHYQAGLQWSSHSPANTEKTTKYRYVIPYTNARGAGTENRDFLTTYIDEWQAIDITAPNWPKINPFQRVKRLKGFATWYHVEPVKSRIDMLLYYHRKMYETFADGIYWDNFFLRASRVPPEAGGPAWVDDEGRLHPGVNLMGFRNLAKRNAVMMHRMGERPLSYIHMTNVNVVPMLSFGTLNLDWEWRDRGAQKKRDLQDRLGVDEDPGLIHAQSMGLKDGNITVAIDRFHPPKDSGISREWLFRTVMATCIPHEIKIQQGSRAVRFVQNRMMEFGYGRDECRVDRYWEKGFPLRTRGANNHALVLSRDGEALIALGNFGGGKGRAEDGRAEVYTVTLELDLEELGLPESAQAYDVERRAGREKAENVRTVEKPDADAEGMPAAEGEEPAGLDLEEPEEPGQLRRTAPGVFELKISHHDFALIKVE